MYPSSNFLGGGQFGQQPPQQHHQYGQQQPTPGFQQPQQQQGPGGFMPQPTGFMGSQLQPQATGFPGSSPFSQPPPQQPQQPGSQFGSSLQPPGMTSGFQQQQQSLQPQHTAFQPQPQQQSLQPQQTAFQQPPSLAIQPTGLSQPPPSRGSATAAGGGQGQTSSQIAQSFQSMSRPQTANTAPQQGVGARIPSQRLSFITATDQAKFEQLFKSAVGDAQSLDGETAKGLLLRSNLPGADLSKIWWVLYSILLELNGVGGLC